MNTQRGSLRLAWYGDDFTGSAAVAEVLTFGGLPSALFLRIPTDSQMARILPGLAAVGLAGTARAESPLWMDKNLPGIFDWLVGLGAEHIHYKVCSTMDSAPQIGSIGRAMDIGLRQLGAAWVPILFAAPEFGRYQAFGQMFAVAPSGIARLDRHPVMVCHPVTPISEADVCRHLSKQTDAMLAPLMLDWMQTADSALRGVVALREAGVAGIALDSFDAGSSAVAGAVIASARFAIGSQGMQSALLAHLRLQGGLAPAPVAPKVLPVAKIAVVSGSVSAITARQIKRAQVAGFVSIPLDPSALIGDAADAASATAIDAALSVLAEGNSPVVHTACGPTDPRVERFNQIISATGADKHVAERTVGEALGKILRKIIDGSDVSRVIVAGGDTSGRTMEQIDIFALCPVAPIASGASLMRALSDTRRLDGLEIVLKGGQMGSDDLFLHVLDQAEPDHKEFPKRHDADRNKMVPWMAQVQHGRRQ